LKWNWRRPWNCFPLNLFKVIKVIWGIPIFFWCKFHQHYMRTFFVRTSLWQLFLHTCNKRKLPKRHSYENRVRITLMKLNYRCKFHQHFTLPFLFESAYRSFSRIKIWLCNFLAKEYRRKTCWWNWQQAGKEINIIFPSHCWHQNQCLCKKKIFRNFRGNFLSAFFPLLDSILCIKQLSEWNLWTTKKHETYIFKK